MFFVKSEGWIDMDHKQFQEWLSGIDHLSPAQRQQTEAVFPGDTETSASLETSTISWKQAQLIVLNSFSHLTLDSSKIGKFLRETGISPAELHANAGEASLLGAVLDYLLQVDAALLAFCEAAGHTSEDVNRARIELPSGKRIWE